MADIGIEGIDPVRGWTDLLDKVREIPSAPPPTFFELAGIHKNEKVASNVLKFFLNPKGSHGLGSLTLAALDERLKDVERAVVETEFRTPDEKRIDILVTTPQYLIGIENKIYAALYNPFESYWECLERKANDESSYRTPLAFLLGIKPPEKCPKHFTFCSYGELAKRIRSRVADLLCHANTKYAVILADFLQTMDNLTENYDMDVEVLELLASRERDVLRLKKEVDDFIETAKKRISDLKRSFSQALLDRLARHETYVPYTRSEDEKRLARIFYLDLDPEGPFPCTVDICFSPRGWSIEIFVRPENQQKLSLFALKRDLKEKLFVPCAVDTERGLICKTFPFQTPPKEVAEFASERVAQLLMYAG
ncbi:MAG: PD-(D/E)XK nuclease family protein [Terriglobia bacterium]